MEIKSLDDLKVVGGKVVREITTERLDMMKAKNTNRMENIDVEIEQLTHEKAECQSVVDKIKALEQQVR